MNDPNVCPQCGVDLKGRPIPAAVREHFGDKTHFSRVIGISDGDSVGYWKCSDCHHRWSRTGGQAEMARRNIDKGEMA